ncbi:MAG TPA: prolipoprotein diacylglyceryl transferase [Syntrophales bacterium]|nr:prolipoprotein diacylglyceryl transferase [Syntrophales bacterium]HOL58414.1 prolipoprotein diacylglyceryl transferase [Syntrophales bacterium]HPO34583.1 prolipoprotein diacylglyceryl transferase [Syntrophales bacterium]
MSWQHLPEKISPVLFTLGPLQIRWYSVMYLVAFALTYLLVLYRIKKERHYPYSQEIVIDAILWCILGLMVGARLGYVVIYNFSYYLARPWEIILPFHFSSEGVKLVGLSGMSYHGGAIGVVVTGFLYCRAHRISFWNMADLFCPAIPLGYTFGRLGNFLNGELFGRPTQLPWGMYFPLDPTGLLRHPSQLYEALFEGVFLFSLLWLVRNKHPFEGWLLSLYLIGYGLVRFFIEFFREPDPQIGFIVGFLTMGQILCLIMVAIGVGLYLWRRSVGLKTHGTQP